MTPPPSYSPPALHFLILDFSHLCGINQFTFWCLTDVACHLTAHVAHQDPIVRRIPYIKRGAPLELSSVTCFVETKTVEQTDAGDTFEHNFTIPLTDYELRHYFYFTGTQGGVPMVSISQIFWVSCSAPIGPIPRCSTGQPPVGYSGSYRCYDWSSAFQPCVSYNITSCDIYYKNHLTPSLICYDGRFMLWTADANGKPNTMLELKYFTNPSAVPGAEVKLNIPLTPRLLTAGQKYAIAWGWYDWHTVPRGKYSYWGQSQTTTCPFTVPPAKYVWLRRYDSGYRTRCLGLLQDWYPYVGVIPHLCYQTYGTDA